MYGSGKLFKTKNSTGKLRVYGYEVLKKFIENNPDLHLRKIKQQFFYGDASLSGVDSTLDKLEIIHQILIPYIQGRIPLKMN